jgi:hypothetical protein
MPKAVGSNPLSSAANRALSPEASKYVMGATPHTPSMSDRQKSATFNPTGVTTPIPVTTTRFMQNPPCCVPDKCV